MCWKGCLFPLNAFVGLAAELSLWVESSLTINQEALLQQTNNEPNTNFLTFDIISKTMLYYMMPI